MTDEEKAKFDAEHAKEIINRGIAQKKFQDTEREKRNKKTA